MLLRDILTDKELVEHFGEEQAEDMMSWPCFEMFEGRTVIINRQEVGNNINVYYEFEGNKYVVEIQKGKHIPTQITFANFAFAFVGENETPDYNLQNWKASPFRVVGGAIQIAKEEFQKLHVDAVVLGVANKYGAVEKRMRLYSKIAQWMVKNFIGGMKVIRDNIQTLNGRVIIITTANISQKKLIAFEEYLRERGK